MSDPSTPAWRTVAEAAQLIGISERALRRLLELPENAAQTRQETRRTRTGTRQAVVINPEWVADQAREHGATVAATPAQRGAPASNDGSTPADSGGNAGNSGANDGSPDAVTMALSGDTPAPGGTTPADGGSNAALTRRLDQLEGIVTGGFLQRLQSQLEAMPTREDMAGSVTEAATAAVQPLLEELRAQEQRHAVEAAEREKQRTQERQELTARLVEERNRHTAELAEIREQLTELKEAKQQRRGFLSRWFGE